MKKVVNCLKSLLKSSQKGFTLIELLIVIAILGILTTAVLSAINPVEQINRGRDTGSNSDAEQLISAMARFNATQGFQVYQSKPELTGVAWHTVTLSLPADDATTPLPILTKLGSSGENELLQAYITRITTTGYNSLYIYNGGAQGDSTYVCFLPQSQQFEKQAVTRCAAAPADFPSTTSQACPGGTGDYICLP